METNSVVQLSDLSSLFKDFQGAFLCASSFEERSLVIPRTVSELSFKKVIIFASTDSDNSIQKNAEIIKSNFNSNAEIYDTKSHEALVTTDSMARAIESLCELQISDLIIDITTFTHEMLLIILKLIWSHKEQFSKVTCIYNGAKEYSVGDEKDKKWLSKGCKEIRSVFGYPGNLVPGRSTCLIVLVGYEHERANRMIVEMDSEFLRLGKGLPSDESLTHPSHKAPMEFFHKLVKDLVSSRGEVKEFSFSCKDIAQTVEVLRNQVQETENYNRIIVPLNTKISTVAVAKIALEYPSVQVCYAEPEIYNFENYSSPDDKATVFEFWSSSV